MREQLWDAARGIGILLVVYGHVLRGLVAAGLVPADSPLVFSDYVIYTFHMPLFFLLAGINAARGMSRDNFISSKIPTIVYPYFLWTFLQGGMQLAVGGANNPVTMEALLSILWAPVFQYWFLSAIFVCHLLARFFSTDPLRLALFAVAAYPAGIYLVTALPVLANPFSMLIFYVAGIYLAPHLKAIVVRLSGGASIAATVLGLGIAVYVASRMGGYRAPSAVCAAFLGILLVLQLSHLQAAPGLRRVFELLGLASMPIFLAHVFATAGARMLLMKLGVSNVPLHLAAGMLAGVAGPLALFYLAYRLRQERVLGFSSGAAVFEPARARVGATVRP